MVSHGANSTGRPRKPPVIAISSVPRGAIARAHDLHRVGADADRNRTGAPGLERALREEPHVVRRDEVDAGEVLLLDDHAVVAAVEAQFRIAGDDDAGGDHRPPVIDRRHRHRQLVEIDLVARPHHLARSGGVDGLGRDRLRQRRRELVLDLAEILAAHRGDGALLRTDDAGDDRHVVADHIVEIERGLRLIDQRRDVPDVDRLVQVDQLPRPPHPVEKSAKPFVHPILRLCPPRHSNPRARREREGEGRSVAFYQY